MCLGMWFGCRAVSSGFHLQLQEMRKLPGTVLHIVKKLSLWFKAFLQETPYPGSFSTSSIQQFQNHVFGDFFFAFMYVSVHHVHACCWWVFLFPLYSWFFGSLLPSSHIHHTQAYSYL